GPGLWTLLVARTRRALAHLARPLRRRRLPDQPARHRAPLSGSPAIAQVRVVLDLGEVGLMSPELVADAFQCRPNVDAKTVLAAASNETSVMHAVVDLAIARETAGCGGEQCHDLVLGEGEVKFVAGPQGPADRRPERELAHLHFGLGFVGRLGRRPGGTGEHAQALDDDRYTA